MRYTQNLKLSKGDGLKESLAADREICGSAWRVLSLPVGPHYHIVSTFPPAIAGS